MGIGRFFKKVGKGIGKQFKKSGFANKLFTKYIPRGLGEGADILGKVGGVASKIAGYATPLLSVVAPELGIPLGMATNALGKVAQAGRIASQGSQVLKQGRDIYGGVAGGISQIQKGNLRVGGGNIGNALEKARDLPKSAVMNFA